MELLSFSCKPAPTPAKCTSNMSTHLYPIFQTSSSENLNSSWHIPWTIKFFRFYLKTSSQIAFIVSIPTSAAITQMIVCVFVLITSASFPFSRCSLDSSPCCCQSLSYKMKPMAFVSYSTTSSNLQYFGIKLFCS